MPLAEMVVASLERQPTEIELSRTLDTRWLPSELTASFPDPSGPTADRSAGAVLSPSESSNENMSRTEANTAAASADAWFQFAPTLGAAPGPWSVHSIALHATAAIMQGRI